MKRVIDIIQQLQHEEPDCYIVVVSDKNNVVIEEFDLENYLDRECIYETFGDEQVYYWTVDWDCHATIRLNYTE